MSKQYLVIPQHVWESLNSFLRSCPFEVEQIVFLEGLRLTNSAVALAFVVPDAVLKRGNYSVPVDSVLECATFMREYKLERVAQIHTHPSARVDHSQYDDENAYSYRDGAISIVLPDYARRPFDLSEIGFHICMDHKWERLAQGEFELRIVPTMRNYRKWTAPLSPTATKTGSMRTFWNGLQKLLQRFH